MVSKDQQPRQVKLNNGLDMPLLGLGVYNMYGEEAENTVLRAFEIGYRLIDTAAMYRNEKDIGNAVIRSGLARTEIFITSKVDNADQGYDATLRAYEKTLANLQTTYLDLYLVHLPIKHKRKETWRAFEKIYGGGAVKAIGVANYLEPFLRELAEYSQIIPAVNQVEFSPYLYSDELLQYCRKNRIQMQAYSPLVRGKKWMTPSCSTWQKNTKKHPPKLCCAGI